MARGTGAPGLINHAAASRWFGREKIVYHLAMTTLATHPDWLYLLRDFDNVYRRG
jgi:hypothetical protein